MTQAGTARKFGQSRAAQSNVYTVLMIVAALALVATIGFVWFRSSMIFGTNHPFELVSAAMVSFQSLMPGLLGG